MSNETVPLTEVKARLSEYADRVEGQHERVTVTRNGRPSFVMIASEDLEGLEETLAILSDADAMAGIRRSEEELSAGDTIPWEQVKAELGARPADG